MELFKKKKIESFEKITWNITGMRSSCYYEILPKDDQAEVSEYQRYYKDGKEEMHLERQTACSMETMLGLLNDCGIIRWNGFHGAHPKHVKDGEMFSFDATVNGDETIKAEGSENFPKHFGDFRRAISELLRG